MNTTDPPTALRVLVRLGEIAAATAALCFLTANLVAYRDETLYLAFVLLVLLLLGRLLPRRRRMGVRLATVGLVAAVAFGELLAVLLRGPLTESLFYPLPDCFAWSDHPTLPYTYRPGGTCANRGETTVRVTERRLCDLPHAVPKPPDVFRIVCLGDSTSVFAESFDNLYHQVLSRDLSEGRPGGSPVELVNGAVDGYNALQQATFFEENLLAFEPDLLVAAYCVNDPFPRLIGWSRSRLRLLRLISIHLEMAIYGNGWDFHGMHDDPVQWGGVVRAYEKIAALAKARDVPVVAFVMPLLIGNSQQTDAMYRQIEALFRRLGFHVLDVHSDLSDEDLRRYATPPDVLHPNDDFHIRLGHRLAAFLRAEGLVPQ